MKHFFVTISLCLLACCLCCCKGKKTNNASEDMGSFQSSIQLMYAQGFKVRTLEDGVRLVDIQDPQAEESTSYHFALVPKDLKSQSSTIPSEYAIVKTPVDDAICMTLLQLADFIVLEAIDKVSGITSIRNLFNQKILEKVKAGKIMEIGTEGNFDAEIVMAANPEVIFISPFKRGGYEAIKQTGITLVPHLGYKELHPLGQAEWIKFIGMFIGKDEEANNLFNGIVSRYENIKTLANQAANRPKVLSGEMHGGNWYAVGGKSFLAQMFADAGADYVLKEDPSSGGVNIEFEKIYAMAADADYWRILNSYPGNFSYEALLSSEPRNELFKAYRNHQVVYCNMKQSPYYEKAPVEPDVVLSDLVHVFHPELLPSDYQPTYYNLLK